MCVSPCHPASLKQGHMHQPPTQPLHLDERERPSDPTQQPPPSLAHLDECECLYELLVQCVADCVDALVHDHLGAVVVALYVHQLT